MGYIRFEISQATDLQGRTKSAVVKRIYSDIETEGYDLNRILHSLTAPSNKVEMWMVLDSGILDRDKLKGREYMILDSGTLEIDYIL